MIFNENAHEEQAIDFETIKKMKDLMSKAKPVLELANNWKILETFVDELNMQYEPPYTTIQERLQDLIEITSCKEMSDMAYGFEIRIVNLIEYIILQIEEFEIQVDIQLTNEKQTIFSLFLLKNEKPFIEITA